VKINGIDSAKQQISQHVAVCINQASSYFSRVFPMPDINFKQRGKIAASAQLQKNTLRFNPVLMMDNLPRFLNEVVAHEVSHLLAFQLYGRVRPHGKEWQALMLEVFGVNPKTYHNMDVSKVVGRQLPYLCACGVVHLSIRRHNKVVRKIQRYRCLKCGEILQAA